MRHIANEDLLQSKEIYFHNGKHMENAARHNCSLREINNDYVSVTFIQI